MIKLTQDENGNKIKYIGTLRTRYYTRVNGDIFDCHLYIKTERHNQDFIRYFMQVGTNDVLIEPSLDYSPKILSHIPDIRKYQHKPRFVKVDTS